jgi:RNA polymerase sigma factor (sigma-70 family)
MPGRGKPDPSWPDHQLVDVCLAGDELAWHALVEKYQRLVFSIARKYGATNEEAADLFQGIWLDAYNDLPKLRKKKSLRSWLISLATHKCYHWKRGLRRRNLHEVGAVDAADVEARHPVEPDFADDLERDQLVREAVAALPERCREMIRMLFFARPPLPYAEVAERLGLAVGSIGFIRGRCLKKLQTILEKLGA